MVSMMDQALKGPTVNFSKTDQKFGKASGKTTSFPKTPTLDKIKDHAAGRTKSKAPQAKKPQAQRRKAKKKIKPFNPQDEYNRGGKPPPKKLKPIRPLATSKKKTTKKPTNGKVLGARILGLRKEVRKLEQLNRKELVILKERRKVCRAKTTELFDLMDNTQQLNLPF